MMKFEELNKKGTIFFCLMQVNGEFITIIPKYEIIEFRVLEESTSEYESIYAEFVEDGEKFPIDYNYVSDRVFKTYEEAKKELLYAKLMVI